MRELKGIEDIMESLKRYGGKVALQIKEDKGFHKLSYLELNNRSLDVSSTLIKSGVAKGTRIAILAENRPEWAMAFFGIIFSGAIVVPLDIKLKEKELTYILNNCEAEYIFASAKFIDLIKTLKTKIKKIISLDEKIGEDILSLKELKSVEGELKHRDIELNDTAVIIYTSGTTGNPKGVELTFKNLFFQILSFSKMLKYGTEDNFLSILSLNHAYELICGFWGPLCGGSSITYLRSLKPTEIISTMKQTQTTIMIVVPLILQMFYKNMMKEIEKSPIHLKKSFEMILLLSKYLGRWNTLRYLLFKKIHLGLFGGRLRCFISGGAPLDPEIATNFQLIGIPVLQGYGLSETSPVTSANTFRKNRIGSVGKPLPQVKVKISDDGEILIRGPHLMKGYFKDSILTQEVIRDGWFHTGDMGEIDKDGFLYIRGRLKNLIVTAGGKKIHPEEVEEEILKSPYVKEICVMGRPGRKGGEEVYAVVVPDYDYFKEKNEEEIKKIVAEEIKKYCSNLADYKRVVDFEIWKEELPKTSTRKVKRKEVLGNGSVICGWCPNLDYK